MAKKKSERLSEVVLRYEVDFEDTLQRQQAYQAAEEASLQAITAKANLYNSAMQDVANTQSRVASTVQDTTRDFSRAQQIIDNSKKSVDEYGDAYRRASQEVESFGDVATNISQVSGVLRGLGAGGVADVAMLGADITDAVEGIRRLGPAIGDVSGKALTAVNAFTGLDLSMGELVGAGAAVGLAIAAVGLALSQLTRAAAEAGEEARREAEARANAIIDTEAALTDMTIDEYETRQQELQDTINESGNAYERLRQEVLDEAQAMVDERGTGPLIGGFAPVMDSLEDVDYMLNHVSISIDRNLDPSLERSVSSIEQLQEGLDQARDVTTKATASLTELNLEYAQSDILANTLAQRERELAQGRNDLILRTIQDEIDLQNELMTASSEQLEQRRQQLEMERTALQSGMGGLTGSAQAEAAARFAELGRELNTINNELLPAVQAREAEEAAIRETADVMLRAIDIQRDYAAFREQLSDVEKANLTQQEVAAAASGKKIDDLTAKFNEFATNAGKQITEAEAESRAERANVDKQYMKDTRKAYEDWRREELEQVEDYQRERIRRIEDLNESLLQAEESNDVISFIRTQRAGQTDLRRMDQDASIEAQKRREQFEVEQDEREDEYTEELVQLDRSNEDKIAAIQKSVEEQRQKLQEGILAERAALQQRLTDLRAALVAELTQRQLAYKTSLIMESEYAKQRRAIEEQKNAALASASQSSYNAALSRLSGASGGGSAASMSAGTRLLGTTFNFSNIQVGSNLSRAELQGSLRDFSTQLVISKQKALRGK